MLRLIHSKIVFRLHYSADYEYLREKMISFPYTNLSFNKNQLSIPVNEKDFLGNNIVKDAIAFASLTRFTAKALETHYFYMFNERPKGEVSGSQIFTDHFVKKLPEIRKIIQNSENEEQLTYYLKVLFYLKKCDENQSKIINETINFKKIIKKGTLPQKAYLLYILKDQNNFLTFLEQFYQQFQTSSENVQLQTALIVWIVPQCDKILPEKLNRKALSVICNNFERLNHWEIFHMLRFIFQCRSYPQVETFVLKASQRLMEEIKNEVRVNTQLIIKLIKIRRFYNFKNREVEDYVKDNPLKFNTIFHEKTIKIMPIVNQISENGELGEEMKRSFHQYIIKILNEASEAEQYDSISIVQALKACLKFHSNLNLQKRGIVREKIKNNIIPMFSENVSIFFFSIANLFILQNDFLQDKKNVKLCLNLFETIIQTYKKSDNFSEKRDCLDNYIQIWEKFSKAKVKLPVQYQQFVFQSNFKQVTNVNNIIRISYLLLQNDLENKDSYVKFLQKFVANVQKALDRQEIRNYHCLIQFLKVFKPLSESDRNVTIFFYNKIEKNLVRILKKEKPKVEKNHFMLMRSAFIENMPKNRAFINLLKKCIESPQAYSKYIESYEMQVERLKK